MPNTQAVRDMLHNAEAAAEMASPIPTARTSNVESSAPIDYAAIAALFPKRSPGRVRAPVRRSKARVEPYPSNKPARQEAKANLHSSHPTAEFKDLGSEAVVGHQINYAYLSQLMARAAAFKADRARTKAQPTFVPDPNVSETDNVIKMILDPPESAFKLRPLSSGGAKVLPRHWLHRMSKQNFNGSGKLKKDSMLQECKPRVMGMSEQYLGWLKGRDWSEGNANPTLEEYRNGAFRAAGVS